jgi:exodeoxyribonuclease V alpha subunit
MRLEAVVQRVRFETDDAAFQVLVAECSDGQRFVAVVRNAALRVGERARFEGVVTRHTSGELQLEASSAARIVPKSADGIATYLASSAVEGIGPAMAKRIVDRFGEQTLAVLDETPQRLREVPGIGDKRVDAIVRSWRAKAAMRDTMIFLQSQGISAAYALRIQRVYGDRAIPIVKRDPYRLARDVHGIGFRIADGIARGAGIAHDDPRRIRAGLEFTIRNAGLDGHTYVLDAPLVEAAAALLEVDEARTAEVLASLVETRALLRDPEEPAAVYTPERFEEECDLAERIVQHAGAGTASVHVSPDEVAAVESALQFTLAQGQRAAVLRLTGAPIGVLTGGPGTGKTTILRVMVDLVARQGGRIELCAPTGRAAQRLSESTGREARTLHRLLVFDPVRRAFAKGPDDPIEADLVVVDEVSMVDQALMRSLIRAIAPGTQVLLVGDVDQLPSVGAGDVLRDLIASQLVPVASLREVFRQAASSRIVRCAHEMRDGHLAEPSADADGDYFFIQASTPDVVIERVVQLVTERMPKAFGLDPLSDIQVLVPMHRGPVGTESLNAALQQAIGGRGPALEKGFRRFHVGDKVMQSRNNYTLDVYNGDIGRVEALDLEGLRAAVRFDDRIVEVEGDALDDLEPAYAVTVHKSQGSEFRAVIVVVTTHHFKLLQRNLLYTAVTRARERLVIVGQRNAVQMAIDNVGSVRRQTGLARRLRVRMRD